MLTLLYKAGLDENAAEGTGHPNPPVVSGPLGVGCVLQFWRLYVAIQVVARLKGIFSSQNQLFQRVLVEACHSDLKVSRGDPKQIYRLPPCIVLPFLRVKTQRPLVSDIARMGLVFVTDRFSSALDVRDGGN